MSPARFGQAARPAESAHSANSANSAQSAQSAQSAFEATRRGLVAAGAAALLLGRTGAARAADDIVVGAALPLTGAFAASGQQVHQALQLAQDDINAAGGVQQGRKLKIVFEDTQASNSVAVNALVKLVRQHKPCFVFLPSLSTQVLAMEPEVARARVATLHGGGAMTIQERRNPWLYRARPADNLGAGAMAFGITQVLKLRRPGLLYAQDDYGTGAANALQALLEKEGVTVAGKEAFNPRDNDFSAQLLSLKSKGADVLVSFNYNRDGALILKQRKSLGLAMPVVAGTAMAAPATLNLVDGADLAGVYSTADTLLGNAVSPASADFVKRYNDRFKMRPDSFGTAYYDGALMLAGALRQVGPDADKLRLHFAGIKGFNGMARSYSTDPATLNMAHSVVLVAFKPGTKELVAVATYPKN